MVHLNLKKGEPTVKPGLTQVGLCSDSMIICINRFMMPAQCFQHNPLIVPENR